MSEYKYTVMSSRPRPVTATVTKQKWMEVSDYRRRSLDSTGSTVSLCSVLDHDSYISESSDDEDQEGFREKFNDMKIEEGPLDFVNEKGPESEETTQDSYNLYSSNSLHHTPVRKQNDEFQGLSPWEKWLLIKTREERIKHKLELRSKKLKEEEQLEKEEEKKQKLAKVDQEIRRWKEQKIESEKLHKRFEKNLKQSEKDCKMKLESEIHEKAEKKYSEWAKTKINEERKRKKEEKQKLQAEEETKLERKMKAEEKYKEWCRQAKKRPMSAVSNTSQGYLSGKLTGYHDTNAYPEPEFCNKEPWHPIKIPKQKSVNNLNVIKKKPSKPKYVWNPNKYY